MIIYRVADRDNKGPYHRFEGTDATDLDDCEFLHPTPQHDVGIERTPWEEELCGFISLESLCKWFGPNGRRYLDNKGFWIWEMEIDSNRIVVGDRQILFQMSDVTNIKLRSLMRELSEGCLS